MINFRRKKKQPHIKIDSDSINNSNLEELLDSAKEYESKIPENLKNKIYEELQTAALLFAPEEIVEDFLDNPSDKLLPFFTEVERCEDYDTHTQPANNFLQSCKSVLNDNELKSSIDGVIINPGTHNFIISNKMINEIISFKSTGKKFVHSPRDLKKLRRKLNTDRKWNTFLRNTDNVDFEQFIRLASRTQLFTYYASMDDLSEYAHEGIIDLSNLEGNIFVVDEYGMKCCTLFTCERFMEPTLSFYKKRGRNIYSQIITLKTMADFIIKYNFDAVIVNYANSEMVIPKEYFKEYMKKITKLSKKNRADYSNYALIV